MNTIGISCTNYSKCPFDEVYETVSREFTHWEIFSEVLHYLPDVVDRYSDIFRSSPLTFSLHTGIADINVGATNEIMREAAVSNIIAEMTAATKIGIDTATVHPGIINLAIKGVRETSIRQAKRSMKEIEKAANDLGITACIENMPKFPVMLGIEADELYEIVDGTDLSICFDIGHANTAGQIDRMVELFGDRIKNVHIHDNLGQNDDHMTIGDGVIDFKHVLQLLKPYSRRYIIEAKSTESAIVSQARLKALLGDQ